MIRRTRGLTDEQWHQEFKEYRRQMAELRRERAKPERDAERARLKALKRQSPDYSPPQKEIRLELAEANRYANPNTAYLHAQRYAKLGKPLTPSMCWAVRRKDAKNYLYDLCRVLVPQRPKPFNPFPPTARNKPRSTTQYTGEWNPYLQRNPRLIRKLARDCRPVLPKCSVNTQKQPKPVPDSTTKMQNKSKPAKQPSHMIEQ
jgi:hypothetical protein